MERQASDYGLTAVQYRTLKRFVQQGARGLAGKLRWDGDRPDYRDRKMPDWLDPEALFALESRHVLVREWEYPEPAWGGSECWRQIWGTKTSAAAECALSELYALPMRIVIAAD